MVVPQLFSQGYWAGCAVVSHGGQCEEMCVVKMDMSFASPGLLEWKHAVVLPRCARTEEMLV